MPEPSRSISSEPSEYNDDLQALYREIEKIISVIEDIQNNLQDSYPAVAFSKLSKHFESISEELTAFTTVRRNSFYDVVRRSQGRQNAVKNAAKQAQYVAQLFEKYTKSPKSYSATNSRLQISKLSTELYNLLEFTSPNADTHSNDIEDNKIRKDDKATPNGPEEPILIGQDKNDSNNVSPKRVRRKLTLAIPSDEEFYDSSIGDIVTQLPSYDSDQNASNDYLGIEQDVKAFASLISARSTLPPLSIGLFGEWGAGKTFFMRKLRERVDEISKSARESKRLQKEIAYYKRIVQIEFNAWHYAEGNLWASLVEHILANLHIHGTEPDIVITLQKKLIQELAGQKIDEELAKKDVHEAQTELIKLERELDEKKAEFKEVAENLYNLKSEDILTIVFESPDIQNNIVDVRKYFEDLGISSLSNNGKEFVNSLDELHQTIKRSNAILVPFVNSPKRRIWISLFLLLLIVAPLVGLMIGWIFQITGNLELSKFLAWVTTVAVWLGGMADITRRSVKWVSDRITPIEKLKKRIDDQVALRQNEIKEQIAQLEKRRLLLEQDKETALRKLEDARRNVELTEEKLKQATPARLLAKFIQDRVESNDYRKHLGVLALVREDFEKLSKFIVHENQECENFQTLADELADEDSRINRIVLYIDDLDRCPTSKVIQVLQAVHLLLAFPLFVVVVAVDARWISGALYKQYGNLLTPKIISKNGVMNDNELGGATALDYLEKIFQIPYWLSQMNITARKAMIDGLIKINLVETGDEKPRILGTMDSSPKTEVDKSSDNDEQLQISRVSNFISHDLNPTTLIISSEEQEFINRLSPLLKRSPRALKRFINVYRLLKSSVPDDVPARFTARTNGEFRIAMFFLAIVTHSPELSQVFLSSLYKFRQEKPKVSKLTQNDWRALFDANEDDTLNSEQKQWIAWIQSSDGRHIRGTSIKRLIWWARRTSRFSFLLEPEVAEWLTIE